MDTNEKDAIQRPQRKHPAHGVLLIEGQPTILFDTVCTKGRVPWLADDTVHRLLREVWQQAAAWLMGRYVLMPDHIHFFAAATGSSIPYDNWGSSLTMLAKNPGKLASLQALLTRDHNVEPQPSWENHHVTQTLHPGGAQPDRRFPGTLGLPQPRLRLVQPL